MAFEDRQKAEEAKYRHDQEFMFKVRNRRNKLFGLWLAETHLGRSGDEAAAYAKEVVMADFERPGDGDVIDKVKEDLAAAQVEISDHMLEKHLLACEEQAKAQVMGE
ncbi:MAG: DUF1476 domain-containing protein [Geminicoccaceae bacterium]|nr:DUF1476 domain-containing protein [Geminicoccaceae bacterium]